MLRFAAWTETEELDTETVARLSYMLAPYMHEIRARNSATTSSLAMAATEVFQSLHFSYDDLYWDNRNFPEAVQTFADQLIELLKREPEWINKRYVTGMESLHDFLQRHKACFM
jgi:hypothetical protein